MFFTEEEVDDHLLSNNLTDEHPIPNDYHDEPLKKDVEKDAGKL